MTNVLPDEELIAHIPGNGKFLYSTFSIFNNSSIIEYFESLGVKLKEEDKGRMFPVSDSAKTVVSTLVKQLDVLGVEARLNTKVEAVHYGDDSHEIILENEKSRHRVLSSRLAESPFRTQAVKDKGTPGRRKLAIR